VNAIVNVPPVGGGGGGGGGAAVLLTVTVIDALAVRPAESTTVSASVWLPLPTVVVFQRYDAVVAATVCVDTDVPSTASWYEIDPEVPPAAIPTFTLPLTLAPLAGLVKLADSGGGGAGAGAPPFATVRFMDAEPELPVASRAVAVSVCGPSGVCCESQLSVIGMLLDVSVLTVVPATDRVTVDAPLAPLTQTVTHTTPLTVAPGFGLVIATFNVPPVGGGGGGGGGVAVLFTVTVSVAVAVRPAASLAVSPSVWVPLATPVVFQVNDALVVATV